MRKAWTRVHAASGVDDPRELVSQALSSSWMEHRTRWRLHAWLRNSVEATSAANTIITALDDAHHQAHGMTQEEIAAARAGGRQLVSRRLYLLAHLTGVDVAARRDDAQREIRRRVEHVDATIRARFAADVAASVLHWVRQRPGISFDELAELVGVPVEDVRRHTPANAARFLTPTIFGPAATWPRDVALAALRAAAQHLNGRNYLTSTQYARARAAGIVAGPSLARIRQAFGPWTQIAEEAGLETVGRKRTYRSRSPLDRIHDDLARFMLDPNVPTTTEAAYAAWAPRNNAAWLSSMLEHTHKPWSQLKREACALLAPGRPYHPLLCAWLDGTPRGV